MRRYLLIAVAIVLGLLFASSVSTPAYREHLDRDAECGAPGVPSQFDSSIRRATRQYMPADYEHLWCVVKAMYWHESKLQPDAVSPAGARGLAQIMPATWLEESGRLDIRRDAIHDPDHSIEVGVSYLARQIHIWRAPRPALCRLRLGIASYNAGAGNIIESQREAYGARCWHGRPGIRDKLHAVTGTHAAETIDYVDRIERTWYDFQVSAS